MEKDVIKLSILSWKLILAQTGSQCNHKCPDKREAQGDSPLAEKKRKKAMCGWKQRTRPDCDRREEGVCWKKREPESEREDGVLPAVKIREEATGQGIQGMQL